MPLPVSAQVGSQGPLTAGQVIQPRLGPTAEVVTGPMYGKYYETTRLGLVFTAANLVAGQALLTATSTTVNFVVFNPPASGKRMILTKTALGYVSGTNVAGFITYSVNTTAVNAVTGTALTINNNLQFGPSSAMQAFSGATVVAMTLLRPSRYSQAVMAATGTNAPWQFDEDLDGSIVVPPGGAFSIGGNIALTTVAICSLTWIELPNITGA